MSICCRRDPYRGGIGWITYGDRGKKGRDSIISTLGMMENLHIWSPKEVARSALRRNALIMCLLNLNCMSWQPLTAFIPTIFLESEAIPSKNECSQHRERIPTQGRERLVTSNSWSSKRRCPALTASQRAGGTGKKGKGLVGDRFLQLNSLSLQYSL